MFGIGFQELVLLSLIGLVVLGPERLPRVANQIGGWLGQARRMTRVMKPEAPEFVKKWVSWGAGPRASQYLILGGKARALTVNV